MRRKYQKHSSAFLRDADSGYIRPGRTHRNNWVQSILFSFTLMAMFGCSPREQVAGVTETGNTTISGILEEKPGVPAVGVEVYLRAADFTIEPESMAKTTADSDYADSTVTDENGFFKFEVEDEDAGSFFIEAVMDQSKAIRLPVEKEAEIPVKLEKQRLSVTGSIKGTVLPPPGGMGTSLVQLLGTGRYAVPDSTSGGYAIDNLPAGAYRVKATGIDPGRGPVYTIAAVLAGEATDNINLVLGEPVAPADGALSGTVQLPQGDSGTFAMDVSGENFDVSLDSVTGDFTIADVPPGAYTLRAWGIDPARDTVEQDVDVLSGALTANVVLSLEGPLPGSISGVVTLPPGTEGSALVDIPGTDFMVIPDAQGMFRISGVPPGMYMVQAWGINPERDTVTLDSVVVVSGEQTESVDFNLPIMVLIIDGINNHDWESTTRAYTAILEGSGLFSVHVSTSPETGAAATQWDSWKPAFSDYDVVILNYNSGVDSGVGEENPWPRPVEIDLQTYVMGGGGLTFTHNTFPASANWEAYLEMKGLGWRSADSLPGLYFDSNGAVVTIPAGQGLGSYAVNNPAGELIQVLNTSHPITRDLSATWLHPPAEMVYRLRGYAEEVTFLSYVTSPLTGRDEPQMWVKSYENGRVFVTTLGGIHRYSSLDPLRCAGFQTTFIRGVEWAATGKASYPVTSDFPSETEISLRDNLGGF